MRQRLAPLLLVLAIAAALWLLRGGGGGGAQEEGVLGSRDAGSIRSRAVGSGTGGPALTGHASPPAPSSEPPLRSVPEPSSSTPSEGLGPIEPGVNDVTGRVVTADGVSLAGATVRAYGAGTFPLAWGRTTRGGRFQLDLEGVDEPLRLVVVPLQGERPEAPPRAAAVLEGVRGGSRGIDLVVPPGGWVSGRVVDTHGEAVRATVKAHRDSTLRLGSVVTEEDGSFRIAVPQGPVRLYAEPRGIGGPASSPSREVFAPAEGVRLVCPVSRTLHGRLVGEGDLSGFHVGWAYRLPDGSTRSVHQTPRGGDFAFVLPGAPFAPLTVMAMCKGDPRCGVRTLGAEGTDVGVLVLTPGLEITGWLRASDGTELPSGLMEGVVVHARHAELGVYWQCDVEADGAFALRGLLPGRYDLSSWLKAFRVDRRHAVHAPSGRIVLRARR